MLCPKASPPSPGPGQGGGAAGLWLRVVRDQWRDEESGHGAWRACSWHREPRVRSAPAGRRLRVASPSAASEKETSFPSCCLIPGDTGPSTSRAPRAWTEGGHHIQCFAPNASLRPLGHSSGMTRVF